MRIIFKEAKSEEVSMARINKNGQALEIVQHVILITRSGSARSGRSSRALLSAEVKNPTLLDTRAPAGSLYQYGKVCRSGVVRAPFQQRTANVHPDANMQ
jgi:hypothetical protein